MGPVKIDFSKISGTSLHVKPILPLKKDFGVMFYERDTRDMYVYDNFEWSLWGRGIEHTIVNWVDLQDTPSSIEPGKIPIGNITGDAIEWTDFPVIPTPIDPTGLEAINEGNGVGWRLIGRDPLGYENIGQESIDFGSRGSTESAITTPVSCMSKTTVYKIRTVGVTDFTLYGASSNTVGTTFTCTLTPDYISGEGTVYRVFDKAGAESYGGFIVGENNYLPAGGGNYGYHVALGDGNKVGGYWNNLAFGTYNTVIDGYSSFTGGLNNFTDSRGKVGHSFNFGMVNHITRGGNFAMGAGLRVNSKGTLAVGEGNTIFPGVWDAADRPIFIVGIGDVSPDAVTYGQVSLRKDGFIVKRTGEAIAPELTTTLIDAEATGKVLVTKEWIIDQAFGGGGVGTLQQVTDVGNVTTNNITTQGVYSSGSRASADLRVILGDYDGTNSIGVALDVSEESFALGYFDSNKALIRTQRYLDMTPQRILFNSTLGGYGALSATDSTSYNNLKLPDEDGTLTVSVNGNVADTKGNITIDTGISNETDTYTSTAKVTHIITLTQVEFDAIVTPSPGTWYAIIG